jgi:hypothetical protein
MRREGKGRKKFGKRKISEWCHARKGFSIYGGMSKKKVGKKKGRGGGSVEWGGDGSASAGRARPEAGDASGGAGVGELGAFAVGGVGVGPRVAFRDGREMRMM